MGKLTSDPRLRLLDAGLKLFANRGYAGTSVQDITEEARVTKPTLYYYFESKEGHSEPWSIRRWTSACG